MKHLGCFLFFVLINHIAIAQPDVSRTVCSGNTVTITNSDVGLPAGTIFTWTRTSFYPSSAAISNSSDEFAGATFFSQTLINTTGSQAYVVYAVTPDNGNPFNITINVNPVPSIGDQTFTTCSGGTFYVAPSTAGVPIGTLYTWTVPAQTAGVTGGTAQTQPQSAISQALTYSGATSGTATYTVTPSASGCTGATFKVTVTVNKASTVPVLTSTLNPPARCSGSQFSYSATATPAGTSIRWTRSAIIGIAQPASSANSATIAEVLTDTTISPVAVDYVFTLTSTTGCINTQVVRVIINPVPSVTAKTATTCSNIPFTVSTSATDKIPSPTNYTWTISAVNPAGSVTGAIAQTTPTSAISQQLVNTKTASAQVTYNVTPIAGSGASSCPGLPFTVIVTVNPVPAITTQSASVCSDVTLNLSPGNVPSGTTYTWSSPSINPTSGAITGGSAQPVPQATISQLLTNTTITNATATYSVTPTAGVCVGNSFNAVITVNPKPAIVPALQSISVCSGSAFLAPQSGVPTNTTYTWAPPQISPAGSITGGAAKNNATTVTQTLTNTTNAPATAIYTIFPLSGNCTGESFTLTVTVNPAPVIINQSFNICSANAFDFSPPNAPSGSTYTWTAPSMSTDVTGGTAQNIPQSSIKQTVNYTGVATGTATYTITPSAFGCSGTTFDLVVTINPSPVVSNLTGTSCSGVSFTVTPTSSVNATTYTWSAPVINPTGAITGGTYQTIPQSNITETLTNNTSGLATATYTIIPFAIGCSGRPFTLTHTVNPTPNVAPIKTTICSGSAFSITPPNVAVGTTYTWTFPVLTPSNSITGASAQASPLSAITQNLTNITNTPATASYTVTPATGSCVGTPFTVEVLVNLSAVSAQVADISTTICSEATFEVKPTGVPPGTTYTWGTPQQSNNVSGGTAQNLEQISISQTLTNTDNVSGTVIYPVTPNSSGCLGKTFNLTVNVKPLPIVTDLKQSDCSGTSFSATPLSNIAGTTYTWGLPAINPAGAITGALARSSGVPGISQTLTNATNSIATATYSVVPTANGCTGNTFAFEETVIPIPTITTQTTIACSGIAFDVSPNDVPIGTTTLYTWSAPVINPANSLTGGSAQSNPLTVINQTLTNTTKNPAQATYNVTPTSGSCVGRSFSVVVTVTPKPVIVDQTTSICSGNAFSITPPNAPQGTKYTWEVPVASNGITGGSAQTTPQPSISQILNNINTNSSTGTAVYTVTPAVGSCNGKPFNVTVYINSNSAVLSSSLTPPSICSGSPFIYEPTSTSPGTVFLWTRDSTIGISNPPETGFGTITESLINTTAFPVIVSYQLSLSTNGCVNLNTQIVKVVVNPSPTLSSSINPPAICSGSSFNYAATSNTFNVVFDWQRSFVTGISNPAVTGQGNISEVLNNPTPNAVIVPYLFTLTANGCTNKQTIYETVNAVLVVQDINIASCSGSTFNVTAPNVPAGTKYLWEMPTQSGGINGGSSQTLVLQPTFSQTLINIGTQPAFATYSVTPYTPATYTAACSGIPFKVIVSVNPIPILSSSKMPPPVCSGTEFNYVPESATPGTIFSWSRDITAGISNQSSSGYAVIKEILLDTTISPIDVTYKFRLNANGCSDTTQKVVVRINPSPVIPDQLLTICSGSEFVLRPDLVPLRTTYTWDAPAIRPGGTLIGFTSQTTPQQTVTDSLTNLTTNMASAFYTIQPVGSSCKYTPFNLIVNVKPKSTIGSQTVNTCSGTDFNFLPAKVPVGTTYTWQSPVYSPAFSISGGSAQPVDQKIINQNLINLTTSDASATYNVTPNSNGCIGDVFSLKVILRSIPTVKITGDASLCRNLSDTINLLFNGTSPWNYTYVDSRNLSPVSVTGITGPSAFFIPSSFPLSDTTYTFTIKKITDGFCLNDTSTAFIKQQLKALPYDTIMAPNGTQICIGKTIPLVLTPAQSSYQWYFNDTLIIGANDINYDAAVAGTYSAKITNSLGCTNTSFNKVKLTQVTSLDIQFSYDTQCKDVEMRFKNLTNTLFTGKVNWLWLFGDGDSSQAFSPVHTYKTEGTKNIKVKATVAACNDVFDKDSLILIRRAEDGVELPSVTTTIYTNIQLQARSIQGNTFKYNWVPPFGLNSSKIPDPIFNFNQSQSYLINMTNDFGCITTDKLVVRVFDTGIVNIFVPKSFSPNRDGVNDMLYPYIAGMKEFHYFKVYNKYGQLLYETRNVDAGWDGTVNGAQQPIGAYVWIAEGVDNTGKLVNKMGNVLLLR